MKIEGDFFNLENEIRFGDSLVRPNYDLEDRLILSRFLVDC